MSSAYTVFKYFTESTDSWSRTTRKWGVAFHASDTEGVSLDWSEDAPGILAGGRGYIEKVDDLKIFRDYRSAIECYDHLMEEILEPKRIAKAAKLAEQERLKLEEEAKAELQTLFVTFLRNEVANYTAKLPGKESTGECEFPAYEKLEPVNMVNEGNCPIKLDLNGLARPEVLYGRSWDCARQSVISPDITITNPTDKPIALTEVAAEYQAADGSWLPFTLAEGQQATHIGTFSEAWRGETSFNPTGSGKTLNLDAHMSDVIAVRSITALEGITTGYGNPNRHRVHHSLPQPLRVRITFKDEADRTISLTYEAVNGPVKCSHSKAYYEEDAKAPVLFAGCANLQSYELETAALVVKDDWNGQPSWTLWQGSSGSGLSLDTFLQAADKARESGASEVLLEDVSKSDMKLWALIDTEAGFPYGLKLSLQTETGSVTEYGLLHVPAAEQ